MEVGWRIDEINPQRTFYTTRTTSLQCMISHRIHIDFHIYNYEIWSMYQHSKQWLFQDLEYLNVIQLADFLVTTVFQMKKETCQRRPDVNGSDLLSCVFPNFYFSWVARVHDDSEYISHISRNVCYLILGCPDSHRKHRCVRYRTRWLSLVHVHMPVGLSLKPNPIINQPDCNTILDFG